MSFVSPFLPYGLFSSDVRIADPLWKKTCPRFLIQVLGEMENMTSAKDTSSKKKAPKAQGTEVDMEWGLRVPVRDGVRLNATLFKPKGLRRKTPAIFTTTPYVADTWHQYAVYLARHGYVFLVFDVRGRGNSEGSFSPWESDAQDGHDIAELELLGVRCRYFSLGSKLAEGTANAREPSLHRSYSIWAVEWPNCFQEVS
jgi:hypothetical protein